MAFFLVAAVVVAYVALVVVANRLMPPDFPATVWTEPDRSRGALGDRITVATWNIGYAGLGADSDFVKDGGRAFFPPSPGAVRRNLDGIVSTLGEIGDIDVMLLQEVSVASPLSYWVPVRQRVLDSLPFAWASYREDVVTRWIPWPLKVDHGAVLLAATEPVSDEIVPLPLEDEFILGLVKRRYGLGVARFDMGDSASQWVIVNLHLSAFDEGDTRQKQIEQVFAHAVKEYEAGNHVVLGGDWNVLLSEAAFPHTTGEEHLFWVREFPEELLPPGWTIVADASTPTARTLHQPFVAGDNYTTILDGFVVSPNVAVDSVMTIDTGFRNTDHMPVLGRFRAIEAP